MPYVLKPNKLFAKDPNGEGYLPQNVITDQATADMVDEIEEAGAEQVASVNTAGATKVAAIEAKGEEVLESIPQDYTELSDEVEENCAKVDGTYSDLTSGNAEQLLSGKGVTDQVPYLFRASGGDGADRAFDKLVGGTVAWNQLIPTSQTSATVNGITFTNNGDGSWTANGTATDRATKYLLSVNQGNKPGHKMLLIGCPSGGG